VAGTSGPDIFYETPFCSERPLITGDFYYTNPGDSVGVTWLGATLTVVPGVWSSIAATVVGQWERTDDGTNFVPFGEVNQYELLVDDDSYGYRFKETATNGFFVSVATSKDEYIEVGIAPIAPYVISSRKITSSNGRDPGATLTKPTILWSQANNFPITVSGEWVKNGVETGVTTATYDDTENGDVVFWRETGTSLSQSTTVDSLEYPVDIAFRDTALLFSNGIDDRIDGLSGGSANMAVFAVKNHSAGTYQFNPNLWCLDLMLQLSGRVVHKTGMLSNRPEDYGGVLITPRHVLYCAHAHPHAEGTWNWGYAGPMRLRFVLADGTVVDAMQIHQQANHDLDICVATLDRDVEALGVNVMPICPYSGAYIDKCRDSASGKLPIFMVSQGYDSFGTVPSAISDYPHPNHDILAHIKNYELNEAEPTNDFYVDFNFAMYDGDSGSPIFALIDNVVYLHRVTRDKSSDYSAPGGPVVTDCIPLINELIAQSDANAVAIGRLQAPTGLTVSLFDPELTVSLFDPDAVAYIDAIVNAGATVSDKQKLRLFRSFVSAKNSPWWSKISSVYLPVWGAKAPNEVELKTLSTCAFTASGVTHGSGFVQGDGSSGYVNFGKTFAEFGLTIASGYMACLAVDNQTSNLGTALGSGTVTTQTHIRENPSGTISTAYARITASTTAVSDPVGIISLSRYEGATVLAKRTTTSGSSVLNNIPYSITGSFSSGKVYGLCINSTSTDTVNPVNYSNGKYGCFAFGQGLSESEDGAFTSWLKDLWEGITELTLP
jgi:hypothetical protein